MSHLFDPISFRGATLRNRITLSPMCQYSSIDGFANEWHRVHYGTRAVGGAGLIILEATGVEDRGRITPNCLGIWKDEHIPQLKAVADFITQHGAVPGIQLAHAGVKASHHRPFNAPGRGYVTPEEGGWHPVGPTAKRFSNGSPVPHELSAAEIRATINSFAQAARRAVEANYKVVELHFAHGYLGHSFLSPLMNERDDEYGGPFDHRIAFLLESVRAVRNIVPDDIALFVRFSCTDWVDGGWTIEDSVEAAKRLTDLGVDLIDCSTGGATRRANIPVEPGYQVTFAEQIKREAGMPTGAVGLITEPKQADDIIRNKQADLVIMGRQLLREPYWPHHAWTTLEPESDHVIAHEYAWALSETRRRR